ncbi:MAG: choice-of-anchor D domain-containing protein [Wenzhouxiangella sp.]|nr:MAG: choice-of-anchor D domain-containing protein [Wenzhouxiangella sp.]
MSSAVFPPADPTGCHDFSAEDWLSVTPGAGTINPAGQQTLALTFDTDGLAAGLYEAELCLFSNDPGANPARIPVSFEVVEFNPIAEITPDQFSFTVFEGRTANDDLLIGNIGTTPLVWSVDTANLLPGLSYAEAVDRSIGEPSLPMGWDRASGRQPEGEVDHVVMGADFGRAVDGPIVEGFDDVAGLPSRGWVLANQSQPVGTTAWFQGNAFVFPAFEGETNSYIAADFNNAAGSGLINNWLLSPTTVLRNGTEIRFYTRSSFLSNSFPDRLEVRFSTAGNSVNVGTSATDVGDFVHLVASINPDLEPGGYPLEWTEVVIRLEGLPEPVAGRVALRYFVEDGGPLGTNSIYIGIDSFSITQPIACEFPDTVDWLSLSFFSAGGTGVTEPGEVDRVTVNVDTQGLALGDYEARVCVTTNDPAASLVEIPVSLSVLGIPVADVNPDSFEFVANAGDSDEGTLTISNVGTADLVWNIETAPGTTSTGTPNMAGVDRGKDQGASEVYVGAGNPSQSKEPSGNNAVFRTSDGTVALTLEEVTSLARAAGRSGPTLSVNDVTTGGFRASGDPNNTLLSLPIGAGNELLGVGWEVTIETFGISWFEESTMTVSTNFGVGGISIQPGAGLQGGGIQTFSSEGVLLFGDFGLPAIPADVDGNLAIEWHEVDWVDVPAGPDSEWSDPATGQVLPPGVRLICADQAACDEAVDPSTPEPPPGVPERCVNPGTVDWLSVSEISGTTGVGESTELTVTADAAALLGGMYEASLCITTNEPDGPGLIEIPITFEVIDIAVALITPDSFIFELDEGDTDTGTINIASIGQLDLEWSLNSAIPRASRQDVLFDNGPIRTGIGDGPNGGDSSLLQNQSLGMLSLGANVALNAAGPHFRMADDFVVDETWLLDSFTFFVYQTGSPTTSTITGVNLRIWDGNPASGGTVIFGDTSTNRLRTTAFTGIYRYSQTSFNNQRPIMSVVADVAGLVLEPGTYYVDVQFAGSSPSGPWLPPVTILGQNTTGNAVQLTADGWAPFVDNGSLTAQGMPFEIRGSTSQCVVPADVPWLSIDPESGSVAPGTTQDAVVSINTAGLLAGTQLVDLCVLTNDPNQPVVDLPLTLTVTEAPGTGFIAGNVQSLGYCEENPFPAAGATVTVEGAGGVIASTLADADGNFVIAVNQSESPVSVTASAPDHVAGTTMDVTVSEGETTNVDFDLRIEQGCTTVFQDEFLVSIGLGESATRQLVLGNSGAAASGFAVETAELLQLIEASIFNLGRDEDADLRSDGSSRAGLIGASEPVIRNIEVTAPRSDISVLIVSPDGELGDPIPPLNLESDLNAFPGINAQIFSGPLAGISVADFEGIDVAVLTNNNRWSAAGGADVIVGNVLADFVDAGGAVILHNFAYDFFGFQLAGRFITENYGPITPAADEVVAPATMVVLQPDSPLFENVNSIAYGSNFRLTGSTLTPGASLMAEWSDGVPMVAMNDHSVSINAMYSSDGEQGAWTGDLNVLVFNAIRMLAGPQEGDPVDWLSITPTSGTVPADGTAELTLVFDAGERALAAGTYRANIRVEIDEGLDETFTVTVPATLQVGEANVQIAHLAPFAGGRADTAVDIVVNGETVLTDVRYGDSTGYLALPPGPALIEVFPVGSPDPAMTASADLAPGVFYTVLAIGDGDNQDLQLKLIEDDLTPPATGTFHLRLGHVAPFASGSATADVRLRDGSPECPAVLENVDFGDVSGFIALPPGEYDLIITSPGGCNVLIDPAPVSFAEGDIASAFATGDGVNQPLGAFALVPGQTGDFLPLVIPGELDVSPNELDFGDVTLGETETREVTVSNVAGEDAEALVLTGLSIGTGAFAITDQGDCGLGSILAGGESCTVEVSFAPDAAGTFSDDLVISAGDGQSQSVPVSGTGVQLPGELAVDTMELSFGPVLLGTEAMLTVMVSNSAPSSAMAISIDQFELTGDSVFELAGGDCTTGLELAPGVGCSIMIDFAPGAAQEYTGQLVIEANGQAASVDLTGRGFERGALGLSEVEVDFGDVLIGNSASAELTLTNTAAVGSAAVLVADIDILPAGDFAVTGGSCEVGVSSLEPGDTCTIEISFVPTSDGEVAASLVVDGSDGKMASAQLRGRGVTPTDRIFDDRFEAPND